MAAKNKIYVIQSLECIWGNEAVWWRAEDKGYTSDLSQAGRYTESEAQARVTSKDIAIELGDAESMSHRSVSRDRAVAFVWEFPNLCIQSK